MWLGEEGMPKRIMKSAIRDDIRAGKAGACRKKGLRTTGCPRLGRTCPDTGPGTERRWLHADPRTHNLSAHNARFSTTTEGAAGMGQYASTKRVTLRSLVHWLGHSADSPLVKRSDCSWHSSARRKCAHEQHSVESVSGQQQAEAANAQVAIEGRLQGANGSTVQRSAGSQEDSRGFKRTQEE
jgi:hypothetical protein